MNDPIQGLVREPMLEGLWYSDDKETLVDSIHADWPQTIAVPDMPVRALVTPYGPQKNTGQSLAWALAQVQKTDFQRVVMVAPCEIERRTRIFLPESRAFRTPLGESPVDQAALDVLFDSSMLVERNDLPHLQENTIELALVYLHYRYPSIPIVPILVGESNEAAFRTVAGALQLLKNEVPGRSLYILGANAQGGQLDSGSRLGLFNRHVELVTKADPLAVLSAAVAGEIGGESLPIFALAASLATPTIPCQFQLDHLHNSLAIVITE